MTDKPFLVANCPTCGATLEGAADQGALNCKYCGNLLLRKPEKPAGKKTGKPPPLPKSPTPAQNIQGMPAPGTPPVHPAHVTGKGALISVISVMVVSGSILGFGLYVSQKQNRERKAESQKAAHQWQTEQEQTKKEQERKQKELEEARFREQYLEYLDSYRIPTPENLDAFVSQSLPENWPVLQVGPDNARLTLVWYATYISPNDKDFLTLSRTMLRKFPELNLKVIPLPAEGGKHTRAMETFLEFLEQKGMDILPQLHENLALDGYRAYHYDRNYNSLCGALDCNQKALTQAIKNHRHLSRIRETIPISRRLNIQGATLFSIRGILFRAPVSDNVLETLIAGKLELDSGGETKGSEAQPPAPAEE